MSSHHKKSYIHGQWAKAAHALHDHLKSLGLSPIAVGYATSPRKRNNTLIVEGVEAIREKVPGTWEGFKVEFRVKGMEGAERRST